MSQKSEAFYARMKKYLELNPQAVCVIEANPADPDEKPRQEAMRDAWFDYLASQGLHATLATWRMILNGAGKAITVPCDRPELFDLAYAPRRRPMRAAAE